MRRCLRNWHLNWRPSRRRRVAANRSKISCLEIRIIIQDLGLTHARGEHAEYIPYCDAQSANTGLAGALSWNDSDAVHDVGGGHGPMITESEGTGREACPTGLRQRIQTAQAAGLECRDLGFVTLDVAHLVDAFEEAVLGERFHGELGRGAVGQRHRLSR